MSNFFSKLFVSILLGLCLGISQLYGQSVDSLIPDFQLRDIAGEEISLSDYKEAKAIVVVFTSSHCSWALKYQPRLNELFTSFQDQGVVFMAINSNDSTMSESDAIARMRALSPYDFPYLKDVDQSVAQHFGATKNPEAFLLAVEDGQTFRVIYQGKIDDNPLDASLVEQAYLKDAIQSFLAGQTIKEPYCEASGCKIK